MKMIPFMALFLSLQIFSNVSQAATRYTCLTKPDPEHGFSDALTVSVSPVEINGQMTLNDKAIGHIAEIGTIDRSQENGNEIIDMMLGYVGTVGLSGIENPVNVQSMDKLSLEQSESETAIFRFYDAGHFQIGGTFWVDGHATACLPK